MKASRSKAKGGRTKSLHIKLPADHPVFSIPDGERSRVAREWMEQGRQVLVVMQTIHRDLTDIKKALGNRKPQSHSCKDDNPEDNNVSETPTDKCKNDINPAVFLNL